MTSPIQAAGAAPEPTEYAALSMDTQFTGIWTQRNPLRDADVPYVYRKFYSAGRFDSMLDGINREITVDLTDGRRPGNAVYNSNTFPPCNSMAAFKWIRDSSEVTRLLYDGTDGSLYDATAGQKTNLFTRSGGTAKTRFLNINSEMFFSNQTDLKKYVQSSHAWQANSSAFSDGTKFIIDSNFNIQKAIETQTVKFVQIKVTFGPSTLHTVTLYLDQSTPLAGAEASIQLTLSGLTTRPTLNGTALNFAVDSALQIHSIVSSGAPLTGLTSETGSGTTGNGVTGNVQPAWATTVGNLTIDAGQQWVCMGSAIQNWGIAAPTASLAVTQAPVPSSLPTWAASTFYAPLFVIQDGAVYYQLTTSGTTGGAAPAFDPVPGHTTADGSAVWTSLGAATWASSAAYAVGAVVQNTYSYSITYTTYVYDTNTHTVSPQTTTQIITVTSLFQCTVAGVSGGTQPAWNNGVGTTTQDSGVSWQNMGSHIPVWLDIGATQKVSKDSTIVGSGYSQAVQTFGKSGTVQPTWATTVGNSTADNGFLYMWKNTGALSPGTAAGAWIYAYSGKNSITRHIGTASPTSAPITVAVGNAPIITGVGLADPQDDQLVLWRTAQGKSTLIYLDTIPNPGAGGTFIYTDTTLDQNLNPLIPAPIANENDPPPTGATAPEYHMNRIWMIVDNIVIYSGGPDTITGSGNEAFPPANQIPFPARPIRLKAKTLNNGGLVVFTTSGAYVVNGTGTASNPFYVTRYEEAVSVSGYDAFTTLGTTDYFMESNGKVSCFDPNAGYQEIGFPIGDQFRNVTTGAGSAATGQLYSASTAFLTWNLQSSGETAMYVADGAVGWFRFSPISPPETGSVWSPRAAIVGGTSAVQSIETSPGIFNLLIAPAGNGPILMRDTTAAVWQDNGASYPSWDAKGVIRLCDTGQIAEIAHIALKSLPVGDQPIVSILMGELAASIDAPWAELQVTAADPQDLPDSVSMYSKRYSALQGGITPKGDCMQLKIDYQTQAFGDELLMFGIYGKKQEERVQR